MGIHHGSNILTLLKKNSLEHKMYESSPPFYIGLNLGDIHSKIHEIVDKHACIHGIHKTNDFKDVKTLS
jgi:hypothetical protein